ncbi:MAG: endolytic transglycosylase MltG [Candidatus Caldatribacteriota bacterium]
MNFIGKLFFLFSVILLLTILVLTAFYFPAEENTSLQKLITIPSGANARQIVKILEDNQIIRKNIYFLPLFLRLSKLEDKLRYGEYHLSPAMNLWQILEKMKKGEIIVYRVTIPEGYTCAQIADLLENKEIASKESFLKLVKENKNLGEGYLFPDTYEVPKGYGAEKMYRLMQENFQQRTKALQKKDRPDKMSWEEIIIMASLIEKEAKYDEEKNIIASVFYNRLKINMKLQSCATIQYILGHPKEKLSEADLNIDSPYNTYLYYGLPPGPICNPGLESIKAALEPAETEWLYFTLGPDGKHIFSRTYEDHLKNKM